MRTGWIISWTYMLWSENDTHAYVATNMLMSQHTEMLGVVVLIQPGWSNSSP